METTFAALLYRKAITLKYTSGSFLFDCYKSYFGKHDFQQIIGCSEKEISDIMRAQNVKKLPRFYVEYLKIFGKQSGDLFLGFDIDMKGIMGLKSKEHFERFIPHFQLKDNMFIFRGQQDHTFLYFLTDADPVDPPAYLISELTYEDDPELWDSLPYQDVHGSGWQHLSEILSIFILERAGIDEYSKFLDEVKHLR